MRLELIVIQGFKSFAEKTEIKVFPGVTCIVGPNGCGKSNVADAVRWALGEQSPKTLRGQKMEDVIFHGAASRKAVGLAEVGLVFNNDGGLNVPWSEVGVDGSTGPARASTFSTRACAASGTSRTSSPAPASIPRPTRSWTRTGSTTS